MCFFFQVHSISNEFVNIWTGHLIRFAWVIFYFCSFREWKFFWRKTIYFVCCVCKGNRWATVPTIMFTVQLRMRLCIEVIEWIHLTRFNKSAWPEEYCSMTSFTSYGFNASRNFLRAKKYLSCIFIKKCKVVLNVC